ncbi:endoribonuclease L-PSP [Prevotella sp. DNF00663]|uniref:Rid family hydrolase n=1 Tax=unclassified Prevotella TaxID=2638335 RepID=UPI0005132BF2|nr:MULTISPECIES: Rid family hydrolase [unclassified Prevotella]KGI61297.1 translation initiation inhibitor [Prevotella sp. S7 MS 2]KXB79474.1 endoribonuclease L-PSP [Prevotella sp. DNF00663]
MHKYIVFSPRSRGSFVERLGELYLAVGDYLDMEKLDGRSLCYCKIFLSDILNQHAQLLDSPLYIDLLSDNNCTIVEQAPADGSKISLLLMTDDQAPETLFHALRLTDEEVSGHNAYEQTRLLFEKYIAIADSLHLTMSEHLVRTWIYVADIDNDYADIVKARNDVFAQYGLTTDTHFIASTGIGGATAVCHAAVGMDFLTFPHIVESDKKYLQALEYLNPTHEYGVAFERGTRITTALSQRCFISGTASIDKKGQILYRGDVLRQTARLLENISMLLKDGGARMQQLDYLVVYLRDISDYVPVEAFLRRLYPAIPHVIVHAKVCRPGWLIEMEGVSSSSSFKER